MSSVSTSSKAGAAFTRVYRRFRGSFAFVGALVAFCVTWIVANCLTHFDPGYGLYNDILSTEASIGTALLLMFLERQEAAAAKQDKADRELLESVKRLGEAQLALVREVHDSLIEQRARKYETSKSGVSA